MTEEIKETLEYMKQKQYISETNINYGYKTLSAGQVELLLDYITNLQRKADILEETNATLIQQKYDLERELDEVLEKKDNLQKENESLKKKLDRRYYKNEYERVQQEKDMYKEQLRITHKDLRYYIAKCEKANELINLKRIRLYHEVDYNLRIEDLKDIENILQNGGESSENI